MKETMQSIFDVNEYCKLFDNCCEKCPMNKELNGKGNPEDCTKDILKCLSWDLVIPPEPHWADWELNALQNMGHKWGYISRDDKNGKCYVSSKMDNSVCYLEMDFPSVGLGETHLIDYVLDKNGMKRYGDESKNIEY